MSTINGTIHHGVNVGQPGYYSPLTITSTGYVNYGGPPAAVYSRENATVVNYGVIRSEGVGNYAGVELLASTSSLDNHGTIVSNWYGVYIYGGVLTNEGTISSGSRFGVFSRGALSIVNTGSISGAVGIKALSGVTLSNTAGTISGSVGVEVSGGTGSVVNSSVIAGGYGDGVNLGAGGSVTNTAAGYISSHGRYAGISISGGAGVVVNSGTISGYQGIYFYTSGIASQTVIDSGTIVGSGGTAVTFGDGNDLMQLRPGNLLIQGTVDGGGGANTLEFAAGPGTLIGEGADFINFGQGTVDSGAQWSIGGNVTLGAGIDLTVSGVLSVAGTLENAGSISPVSYAGLQIAAGGYLRNDASGTIINTTSSEKFNPTVFGVNASGITVVNLGAIEDPAGDASIYLSGGGTVVNGSAIDTSALISGPQGIYAYYAPATITNFGSIVSGVGLGVALIQSGAVTNGAAGSTAALIYGNEYGVFMVSGAGTVTNFGKISSDYYAIVMRSGDGTVVDSGVITGGRMAISFGGSDNLLVLEDGFTITGAITASGIGNVVELHGSAGAPVAATYNTLGLSGFQTAAFAPGNGNYATWTITNSTQLPGTIAGFTGIHDAIDLTTLSDINDDAITNFNTLTDVLTVTGDNGSVQLQLDSEDYTGNAWTAQNDGSNGTELTPLCFCAGTYLATPHGEELVERLKAGDLVLTAGGESRPIVWVGTGRVLATRGRRNAATPVIVRKGAIAPNVPHRDLHVTKGHSLYLDGVLVPVEFLVNHRTILWDDHAQQVTLYHVELDSHDVLVANGMPAESYRDDGNRWLFQNANDRWDEPPQPPCAEVLTGGPIVDAIWQRLLTQTGPRPNQVLTDDPDLHLLVDGRRLDATEWANSAYVFILPAAVRSVRIASRAAAPAELGLARDPRVLGISLRRVVVRAGRRFRIIDTADERLVEGFHDHEPDNGLRWTDGDAVLPVALFEGFVGRIELVLHMGGTTQYRADDRSGRTAA
jgi:hypothetical protein